MAGEFYTRRSCPNCAGRGRRVVGWFWRGRVTVTVPDVGPTMEGPLRAVTCGHRKAVPVPVLSDEEMRVPCLKVG